MGLALVLRIGLLGLILDGRFIVEPDVRLIARGTLLFLGILLLIVGTVVVLLLLFIIFLRVALRTLLGVAFLTLGLSLGLVFLTTGLVIVAGLRVGMYACLKGATLQ